MEFTPIILQAAGWQGIHYVDKEEFLEQIDTLIPTGIQQ
jgi:hypothetical protein